MEVTIVVLIIVATGISLLWVVGGIDNDRPVTDWSDEKLERMMSKYTDIISRQMNDQMWERAGSLLPKRDAIYTEIKRREQIIEESIAREAENAKTPQEKVPIESIISPDLSSAALEGQRDYLIKRLFDEKDIPRELADFIIDSKIENKRKTENTSRLLDNYKRREANRLEGVKKVMQERNVTEDEASELLITMYKDRMRVLQEQGMDRKAASKEARLEIFDHHKFPENY